MRLNSQPNDLVTFAFKFIGQLLRQMVRVVLDLNNDYDIFIYKTYLLCLSAEQFGFKSC